MSDPIESNEDNNDAESDPVSKPNSKKEIGKLATYTFPKKVDVLL